MENKKHPHKDLLRWRGTLTNFGLMISISAVLAAFEWKAYEDKPLLDLDRDMSAWEDDFVPPITITLPPPPPVVPPQIKVIDNEVKLDPQNFPLIDIDLPNDQAIPPVILDDLPVIETAPEIVDFTEVMASFVGGMEAWYTYLKTHLKYPKQEQRMGIEGTVILRFVINIDGSIQDIEVIRSASPGLDQAAVTVIENSPKWNPGKNGGRPVRSRMTMPIRFKLQ
ncbi:MAG: energy transducer TonB [Algoriphagus aquaeductus]|uniref:energy transducer TonB n=1 Tax=Algoriphagus aquaeductus TaxID=475299 RepID=UPI00391A8EA0